MKQTKIGNLHLVSMGHSLQLKLSNRPGMVVTLDQDQLRDFLAFARSTLHSDLNQRSSSRVKVLSSSGLSVTLIKDGKRHPVSARNLSLTGSMIDLPPDGRVRSLPGDKPFELELALDGVVTTLQARIARRAGTAYGLVFPSCIKNGMPDPPASLMSMIETLKHHFDQGMRALEA